MAKQKIKICFKDGLVDEIPQKLWDDYQYVDHNFVVKRQGQWIAIYNMDDVSCVVVDEKGMGKKKKK